MNPQGTIIILGGTKAVSRTVERQLASIANTKRVYGEDRYGTNLAVLAEVPTNNKHILVCSGENYPDALSASATGAPILLVGKKLTADQKKWLSQVSPTARNIYVVGGELAVSKTVMDQLSQYRPTYRVAGKDRYATSVAIAIRFFSTAQEAVFATGKGFKDALSAGPLASSKKIPLLLSSNDSGFIQTYRHVIKRSSILSAIVLGGPKVVPDDATGLNKKGKKVGLLDINGDLYYSQSDGSFLKNVFKGVSGNKYYFGSDFKAKKGTIFNVNGKTFGAQANGVVAKDGWVKIDDLTYYFEHYVVNEVCLQAKSALDRVGHDLESAYYRAAAIPYISMASNPNWGSFWFAGYGFTKGRGNCYVMASMFYVMAKMLGYDIIQVAGTVHTSRPSVAHSWTYITHDGKTYIYDPEVYNEHRVFAFKTNNGHTRWHYNSGWKEMPLK